MLTALNYDKVEMHTGKPYDITAVKDDKNTALNVSMI